jgi:hypothetical protein
MQVRMCAFRVMQEAGRGLPLHIGEVYDLADVVAPWVIAPGVAEHLVAWVSGPDELKPAMVPETGRRRRR